MEVCDCATESPRYLSCGPLAALNERKKSLRGKTDVMLSAINDGKATDAPPHTPVSIVTTSDSALM